MTTVVQIELWQLILLLLTFFGALGAFGKVLLDQFNKRLDERFTLQDSARATDAKHWDDRYLMLARENSMQREDLHKFKVRVAEEYWRREDALRQEVVLHAKIDALALKIDNWALRLRTKNHDAD